MQPDADLLALATELTTAEPTMGGSRRVALAIGWMKRGNSRKAEWFHPEDCQGGVITICGLHGTDVWREPLDYCRSVNDAMALVPKHLDLECHSHTAKCEVLYARAALRFHGEPVGEAVVYGNHHNSSLRREHLALAITIASLRALATPLGKQIA